ncbi:MAG: DUF4093 domain-containing protein [Ruminococcaceae bacterium]|nr:DUF4093 domain-containing protein [Oscillospiraceae bacterium]
MKLPIKEVVICEGRYDKIKLESLLDADIIALDGFGIFKNHEKKAIIREAAKKRGVIVLTDSDNAGMVIRNHIKSITGDCGVYHLYTPRICGKESRKAQPSKEGVLGVEGIDADELRRLFERFASSKPQSTFTRAMLYEDGLMGGEGSAVKRELLCQKLGLPRNMGVGALLQALSIVTTKEEYKEVLNQINEGI